MATVPTPFHYTANTVPTAANLNAGTEDALKWVMDPPRVSVYHSADRTLTTATWTLAIFDSENWDQDGPGSSGGMHSVSSNTSRLVAPTAGRYLVSALVYFAGNATGGRGVNFTKNGAGTRSSSNAVLSDAFVPGVANTNSAMNARLMKYAASTRPTVMKNGVNNRPWASGCRAMPEIRARTLRRPPLQRQRRPTRMANRPRWRLWPMASVCCRSVVSLDLQPICSVPTGCLR